MGTLGIISKFIKGRKYFKIKFKATLFLLKYSFLSKNILSKKSIKKITIF